MLYLSEQIVNEIRAHGAKDYPNETCGAMLGLEDGDTDRETATTGVDSWIEDFRQDVGKNTLPTLLLHGDADRILPADATSRRQAKLLKDVRFVELKGGPHGLLWTHADEINSELIKFLA